MKKFNRNWAGSNNRDSQGGFNKYNDNPYNDSPYNKNSDRSNDNPYNGPNSEQNPFGSFRDPYSNYRSNKNSQRENWNPNWHDPEYFSYLYAKQIFTYILLVTSFIFFLSLYRRRREVYYYDNFQPEPYGNPVDMYKRVPYPPQPVPPAYNTERQLRIDDPYVNGVNPVLRK